MLQIKASSVSMDTFARVFMNSLRFGNRCVEVIIEVTLSTTTHRCRYTNTVKVEPSIFPVHDTKTMKQSLTTKFIEQTIMLTEHVYNHITNPTFLHQGCHHSSMSEAR